MYTENSKRYLLLVYFIAEDKSFRVIVDGVDHRYNQLSKVFAKDDALLDYLGRTKELIEDLNIDVENRLISVG